MSVPATAEATVLDRLEEALRRAGTTYNSEAEVPPVAVLWPDHERQWAALTPALRERGVPLLTLGPYDPNQATGPAYWIRYVLVYPEAAGLTPDDVPVIYLPGIARNDLRAIEECPKELQPLASLQYRAVFWSYKSARDWTIGTFLQAPEHGIGVSVAPDPATRTALRDALTILAEQPVDHLRRQGTIDARFIQSLLIEDEARLLLEWLNDTVALRRRLSEPEWAAFTAMAAREYNVDLERDGEITVVQRFAGRSGRWATVWDRFREAPRRYPEIPNLLRGTEPDVSGASVGQLGLFGEVQPKPNKANAQPGRDPRETWPQINDDLEQQLRAALRNLNGATATEARRRIAELEREHGERRDWVWADLGEAPLAKALGALTTLAERTRVSPGGPDVRAIATRYAEEGWQADAAALDALAAVTTQADAEVVSGAVVALYRPWLEETARAFQEAVAAAETIPDSVIQPLVAEPGTCVVFADGLRYDVAQRLAQLLGHSGQDAEVAWRIGPLPGVTPTAKPAMTPVADRLGPGSGFGTVVRDGGKSQVTQNILRGSLEAAGWQPLTSPETGDPSGRAWTEIGQLDSYGHGHGLALAKHATGEIGEIAERVRALLDAGWQEVRIVTDHGWLLLPGGLPKAELPQHLTEERKGRCARLKSGSATDYQTIPWHWDPSVRIAIAPGIACFEAGKVYEHGGLSPQECVIPIITVRAARRAPIASIESVEWHGLRVRVTLTGVTPGLTADIRTKPGDPTSSLAALPKAIESDGTVSLVVENEDYEGSAVAIVIVDQNGSVIAQANTTVGG